MWTGYGIVTVQGIPNFNNLRVSCNFAMACDKSGKFMIDLEMELGSSTSFTIMGNQFSVGDIGIQVTRENSDSPMHVNITGSLSGISNIVTTLSFDLPWDGEMAVSAIYRAPGADVLSNNMQV